MLWLLMGAHETRAQIPQTLTNLRVLPSDIASPRLVELMVSFSKALDVRCVFCHVGEDSPTLAGIDFASDARPTKKTARLMIALTNMINARLTADLGPPADALDRVRCVTCHRGSQRPGGP